MKEVVANCIIRSEHTDLHGHLNNSRYAPYFECGRIALQEEYGLNDEELKKAGIGFWVRDSYVRRILQIQANQEVEIHSRFVGYSGIMAYIAHRMVYAGKDVATAITEHYLVELGQVPKAIELPEMLTEKLTLLPSETGSLTGLVGVIKLVENEERERRISLLARRK